MRRGGVYSCTKSKLQYLYFSFLCFVTASYIPTHMHKIPSTMRENLLMSPSDTGPRPTTPTHAANQHRVAASLGLRRSGQSVRE